MRMHLVLMSLILLSALGCAPGAPDATQRQPQQSARTSPVGVGEMAPDFTLEDQAGGKVTLSEARGKQPVVLVFYRGKW